MCLCPSYPRNWCWGFLGFRNLRPGWSNIKRLSEMEREKERQREPETHTQTERQRDREIIACPSHWIKIHKAQVLFGIDPFAWNYLLLGRKQPCPVSHHLSSPDLVMHLTFPEPSEAELNGTAVKVHALSFLLQHYLFFSHNLLIPKWNTIKRNMIRLRNIQWEPKIL